MSGLWIVVVVGLLAGTALAPTPHASRTVGDLRLDMALGKVVYQPGEQIAVLLSVTNTSSAPVALTTSSGQQYDVFVRQRGALIWQWSHDKAFMQMVREFAIAPGQTVNYQVTWDQRDLQWRRVEPGHYDISCVFLGVTRSGAPAPDVGPIRVKIGY